MDLRAGVASSFPPVDFAIAYGSGVFKQAGYDTKEAPMVDMVFAVRDPVEWHARNLERNRSHYSFLGRLGARSIASIQEDFGAGIYYNTLVPLPPAARGVEGQTMKYGVISVRALLDDLCNWKTLYISGRMHKPVRILASTDPAILKAARSNLRHALSAALLMLPRTFSLAELYTVVAGLSYSGDFRMVFGENPHKVANIVSASMSELDGLYAPVLAAAFPIVTRHDGLPTSRGSSSGDISSGAVTLEQDVSAETRLALGLSLPFRLQQRMADAWCRAAASSPPRSGAYRSTTALQPGASAVSLAERGRRMIARLRAQRLQWLVSRSDRQAQRSAAASAAGSIILDRTYGARRKGANNASSTVNWDEAAPPPSEKLRREQMYHLLEDDEMQQQATEGADPFAEPLDGASRRPLSSSLPASHFNRAVSDPGVMAFWEAMLHESGAHPTHLLPTASSSGGAWRQGAAPIFTPVPTPAATLLPGLSPPTPARTATGVDVAGAAQVYLRPAIAHIVGTYARTQSAKGVLTAGPWKAALYGAAKLRKYVHAVLK